MKIKVEVEVPDEEICDQCDVWIFKGMRAYCPPFKYYLIGDVGDEPCQPCLTARKQSEEETKNE